MRRLRVIRTFAACIGALTLACDRPDGTRTVDSPADTAQPAPAGVASRSTWSDELGQLLMVPSDSDNTALVLYPAEPTDAFLASRPVTFVSASGDTTVSAVGLSTSDSVQCGDVAE